MLGADCSRNKKRNIIGAIKSKGDGYYLRMFLSISKNLKMMKGVQLCQIEKLSL